ncbi:spm1 [Cryptosporidium bovis]|uniref:spm1 n=1 Tax=Cryptosporidium bovis TaxID=310047 RepID=UPI00351A9006|nr:spm1 [Cryptosporidium bovis]
MRNIKFSSLSPKDVARNSGFAVEGQEKRAFNSPKYTTEDHLGLKDYRFLHKINKETEIKGPLGGFLSRNNYQNTYMRTSPVLQTSNSIARSFNVDNIGFSKERHSVISGYGVPIGSSSSINLNKESLSNNDLYNNVNQMVSGLPLLPPNKYSYGTIDRINMNIGMLNNSYRISQETDPNVYSLDKKYEIHSGDTQSFRKRPLEQVYRKKFGEGIHENEDDEFHDAISDDDNIEIGGADSSMNPKKSNLVPPFKKIYNNTPSTQAQTTGVVGTQTNTPNKPTNTYRLPLSLIEDDFKLERTPKYNFNSDNIQHSQNKINSLELTQYSHPYNFNKKTSSTFFTLNKESKINRSDNKSLSSTQRIRTPLRYRSSLVGAVNSKPNSSCRILSAAEMKRIFCKSRKPIGSLKDFVHTIDTRNDTDYRNNSNFESSILNNTEIVTEKVHSENNANEACDENDAVTKNNDDKPFFTGSNMLNNNIKKDSDKTNEDHFYSELNGKKKEDGACVRDVDEKAVVGQIVDESKDKVGINSRNDDSSKDKTLNIEGVVISDSGNSMKTDARDNLSEVEKKKDSNGDKDTINANNEETKGACETNQDVPWWLANVGKPNLVEVDNEGVFLSDEETSNKKDEKQASPTITNSSLGLFSVQEGDGNTTSLFSFSKNPNSESNILPQTQNKDLIPGELTGENSQASINILSSVNPDITKTAANTIGTTTNNTSNNSVNSDAISSAANANINIENNATCGKTMAEVDSSVSSVNKDLSSKKVDSFPTFLTENSVGTGLSLFGITPNLENMNKRGIFSDIGSTSNLTTTASSTTIGVNGTNNNKLPEIGTILSTNNSKSDEKEQVRDWNSSTGIFNLKNVNSTINIGSSLFGDSTISTNTAETFQQSQLQTSKTPVSLFGTGPINSSASSTGIFDSNSQFNGSKTTNSSQISLFGSTNTGDKSGTSGTNIFGSGSSPNTTGIFGNISDIGIKRSDTPVTETNSRPTNDLFSNNIFNSQSNSNAFQGTSLFGATGLGLGTGIGGTGLGTAAIGLGTTGIGLGQGGTGLRTGVGAGGFGGSITPEGSNSIFNSQNQGNSATGMNDAQGLSGSLFGIQSQNLASSSCTSSAIPFSANLGSTGSNTSFQVSPNPTNNIFSHNPIFGGNNNNSTPFAFGSNTNVINQQDGIHNTSQSNLNTTPSSSSMFGIHTGGGIFGSAKSETNIFGNIGSMNQGISSPFDQRPQQDITGQPKNVAQSGIFGSNPPNFLGQSQIISGNNPNPFVGHSSMHTGSSTHRRRIARAKRSH